MDPLFDIEMDYFENEVKQQDVEILRDLNADEVPLTDPDNVIFYEELLSRMRNQIEIGNPLASRIVNDAYFTKINKYIDENSTDENESTKTQCEYIKLSDNILNSFKEAFRIPKNADDFLEILFSSTNNLFNGLLWPQEEALDESSYSKSHFVNFEEYIKCQVMDLFCSFYKKLKALYNKQALSKENKLWPGIVKYTTCEDEKWVLLDIQVDNNKSLPKYGQGICIITKNSDTLCVQRYFGSVLERRKIQQNQKIYSILSVKSIDCPLKSGEHVEIMDLFNFAHYFYSVEGLLKIKDTRLARHVIKPTFASSFCGLPISCESKPVWDLNNIVKALDTVALSIPDVSPYCVLDYRDLTIEDFDFWGIVEEIFLQIHENKDLIITMNPSLKDARKFPGFCVSSDRKTLSHINKLLKAKGLKTYYASSSEKMNDDNYVKMAKNLATVLLSSHDVDDEEILREVLDKWDDLAKEKSSSLDLQNKFKEFIDYAHVLSILNADVILGHIVTLSSNKYVLSAKPYASYCVIVDSENIVESSTWSLSSFGVEKFIFMSRLGNLSWPKNRSFFCKLMSIFAAKNISLEGSKSCVITKFRKKPAIPEPPKESRHKQVEIKLSTDKPHGNDYHPEKRKNNRMQQPYCPKPQRQSRNPPH